MDRAQKRAIEQVLPNAMIRYCTFHISQAIKEKLESKHILFPFANRLAFCFAEALPGRTSDIFEQRRKIFDLIKDVMKGDTERYFDLRWKSYKTEILSNLGGKAGQKFVKYLCKTYFDKNAMYASVGCCYYYYHFGQISSENVGTLQSTVAAVSS